MGNPGCPPMVGSPPHGTLCKILKGPPLHLIGDTWGCQENVNIDLYPRQRGLYETFCWLRQRLVRKAIIGNSLLCQLQLALTSASAANHCYSIRYWSVLVSIGQYWVSVETGNPTGLYQLLILRSNTANSHLTPSWPALWQLPTALPERWPVAESAPLLNIFNIATNITSSIKNSRRKK